MHGKAPIAVRAAIEWIRDTAFDLWQLCRKEETAQVKDEGWKPLQPGWYKCNTDGAFSERTGSGATGVILKSHDADS